MKIAVHNIYKDIKCRKNYETFTAIAAKGSFKVEKIVSNGAKSPDGFWYNQALDEFVLLLRGKAKLVFDGGKTVILEEGDFIIIPKKVKHRVEYTSSKPKCVWLCVHGKFK